MLQEIAVISGLPLSVLSLEEAAGDYARASKSAATRRAYQTDAADFTAWCQRHALEPLPASVSTVAAYLAGLAEGWAEGLYHHAAHCWHSLYAPHGGLKVADQQRGHQGGTRRHQAFGWDSRDTEGAGHGRDYPRYLGRDAR